MRRSFSGFGSVGHLLSESGRDGAGNGGLTSSCRPLLVFSVASVLVLHARKGKKRGRRDGILPDDTELAASGGDEGLDPIHDSGYSTRLRSKQPVDLIRHPLH